MDMGLIQELFGAIEDLRMSLRSAIYIQNRKLGPVGQVRYDRLGHRSSLFMVSGVSKNQILKPEYALTSYSITDHLDRSIDIVCGGMPAGGQP